MNERNSMNMMKLVCLVFHTDENEEAKATCLGLAYQPKMEMKIRV